MEYTKRYNELKNLYSSDKEKILIPGSQVTICNTIFRSESPVASFSNKSDTLIPENQVFTYPLFTPPRKESKKVILLLHGLNERSWIKYLVWAYYLAENTGSYVILFPISFHINRSPESWKDPRAMIPLMKDRCFTRGDISMLSFANTALSNRLTEDPMRFFKSGYQTATDITKLLVTVRDGLHPVIPATDDINIFAYSIGAFLAEILMMGNPENLFEKSKLFIFCGGSVFSNMHGTSKLIMDKVAYDKIYSFYLNDFEESIKGSSQINDFFRTSDLGLSFRAMIDLGRLKSFREKVFRRLKGQIHSITLLKDKVIPAPGIVATLNSTGKTNNVNIWDFPYEYSHENPFPILKTELSEKVDFWFERVFSEAQSFLI